MTAADLSQRLAARALNVCQTYLSNGRRCGAYWLVGDVDNTPGRSLYVRLTGRRAGRWTDAATAQYGDLLDLIRHRTGVLSMRNAMDEARRFLALPHVQTSQCPEWPSRDRLVSNTPVDCARRLFAVSRPIAGTLAARYLADRGIEPVDVSDLRFHARAHYRDSDDRLRHGPALIAAVRDNAGCLTGVHRTWIDASSRTRLFRKARGRLRGNAVRFGHPEHLLLAGEGIETVLSLKVARPGMAMAAALSAANLAAFLPPENLQTLIIARDNDAAGKCAARILAARCAVMDLPSLTIVSRCEDFNADLAGFGKVFLTERLGEVLACIHKHRLCR